MGKLIVTFVLVFFTSIVNAQSLTKVKITNSTIEENFLNKYDVSIFFETDEPVTQCKVKLEGRNKNIYQINIDIMPLDKARYLMNNHNHPGYAVTKFFKEPFYAFIFASEGVDTNIVHIVSHTLVPVGLSCYK